MKPSDFEFIRQGACFQVKACVTFGCNCNSPVELHAHVESIEEFSIRDEKTDADITDLYNEDEVSDLLSDELGRPE